MINNSDDIKLEGLFVMFGLILGAGFNLWISLYWLWRNMATWQNWTRATTNDLQRWAHGGRGHFESIYGRQTTSYKTQSGGTQPATVV